MDGDGGAAGVAAGPAPAGPVGWWPLRHVGPERPVPPRHQPQQPPQAAAGPERTRHHRAQREANAAGSGGRAARQRPPGQGHHRRQQAPAQVPGRHDQGQAGEIPPEPAGQTGGLLRAFGHRGGPHPEAAPVRLAQEDGVGAVQALHSEQARAPGHGSHHQAGQEDGGLREPGGMGHPRGSYPRASGAAESRTDPSSTGHPGLRAGADRGQGHPAPSPGVHALQRGLRRRPDGGAHPAVGGGGSSRRAP